MVQCYAIRNYDVAAFENLAIQPIQIDLPLHLMEEGNAGAEQNGMDVQDHFIDQTGFEETFRQFTAAKETNAFALRALQFLHESRGIRLDDFDACTQALLSSQLRSAELFLSERVKT